MRKVQWLAWFIFLCGLLILVNGSGRVTAAPDDNTFQTIPFSQDWSNPGQITTNDDWSGVPGILGYLGDYTASSPTGVDPQTLISDYSSTAIDVIANQTLPNTLSNGGVAEFDLTDDVVALNGSGAADAPYLLIHLDTTGDTNIQVSYNLRDLDGSADNAIQQVALHYRVGGSGSYTNIPSAYVSDATTGPSLATLVTPVTVTLPVDAENQPQVYLRIMTTNAVGSDEWVGIDDISIIIGSASDSAPTVDSTTPADSATNVALASNVTVTFSEDVTLDSGWYDITCGSSGTHTASVSGGPLTWTVDPDSDFTAGETCTVTVDKDLVHDSDGDDPPDNMTADEVWSFTTLSAAFGSCGDNTETLISAVQGSGSTSPLVSTSQVIEGVVVGDFQTVSTELSGFYLQEEDGDADGSGTTSEGIFVFDNGFGTDVATGDVVRVMGTVTEFTPGGYTLSLTEIGSVVAVSVCSSGSSVTPATITLPAASTTELEQYEGMSVTIPQTLTVTETFTLGRYGELLLAANGRVFQYTHTNAPSVAGNTAYQTTVALQTIVLDDANTQQNRDPILQPGPGGLTAANTVRSGYTVAGLTGVLDHRYDLYRIQRNSAVTFSDGGNARTTAPTLTGSVRVASFNTLNYFTTIDTGSSICGPLANQGCRGADSSTELTRQRDKTVQAILGLDADIVGLMEMENHATDAALTDLVDSLNAVAGSGTYAKITTGSGPLGDDAIKVALIYQPGRVTPSGSYMSDSDAIFDRPPLAQTFQVNLTGEVFTVVVNHFKSKSCSGATGADLDQSDGQGCYNDRRDQQATQLLSFISTTVIPTSGDPDVLIIGDLNSYAMEDPITTLTGGGYVNLFNSSDYSYVFDGQWGNLDHALSTAAFTAEATTVTPWHINADEPISLDYNLEFKSVGQQSSLYNGDAYRSSDHDPMLIGLFDYDFSDSPTSYGVAWHTGGGSLYLGNNWTSDLEPNPNSDDGSDDGVVRSAFPWQPGNNVSIDVTASGDGYLACWFDWDNDGSFAVPSEQAVGQNIVAGTQTLNLTVGAAFNNGGNLYVRCRLYPFTLAPEGVASPTGQAIDGEVEDYLWQFSPTAVGLQSAGVNGLQTKVLVMVVGLVAFLTLIWYCRPQPHQP